MSHIIVRQDDNGYFASIVPGKPLPKLFQQPGVVFATDSRPGEDDEHLLMRTRAEAERRGVGPVKYLND